jgi:hypothetical protein
LKKQKKVPKGVKILVFDIETAPVVAYVWSLWDQTVGLNQIVSDWHILSWAAKWLHEDKVMYMDQRNSPSIENDKDLLKGIWKLLDEADIVITQNGKSFDSKKLNARFILNGFDPPSAYRHIDTKIIASKNFAFTSNKLEYMSNKLCTKNKKLKKRKFEGFELWKQCLANNKAAWKEMEIYNKADVLATEELFYKLEPWGRYINYAIYSFNDNECVCGKPNFMKNGFYYTNASKFQKYRCRTCGAERRDSKNLIPKGLVTGRSLKP